MLTMVQKEDLEKAEARIKILEMAIDTLKNRVANIDKQLQELASINRKYGPIDPYKPSMPRAEPCSPKWYPQTNPGDWTSPGYPPYTVTCDTTKIVKHEKVD